MNKSSLKELRRTLQCAVQLVWESGPGLTVSQGILAVLQALLPLATLWTLKRAVDAATLAVTAEVPAAPQSLWMALKSPEAMEVVLWLLFGALAMGLQACIRSLGGWISEQHGMAVSDLVHARLHEKMLNVDLAFFDDSKEQDRLHLVQQQAMTQPILVLGTLFQTLHAAVGLAGILVLLGTLHAMVPWILLVSGIPLLLIRLQHRRRLFVWRRAQAPDERVAAYYHNLMIDGRYAQELRIYGHGSLCRTRFEKVRHRLRMARLQWRRYIISRELLVQAVTLAVLAAALLWLTGRLLSGLLTLGSLVMAVQAMQRGQSQLGVLADSVADIYQSGLFFRSFEEVLELPLRIKTPHKPAKPARPLQQGIVFDRVSFAYPGTEKIVLNNVSFRIKPGEKVALAGANGSGKTTLVKLLARFYDPLSGRITVDGLDLREIDPLEWRSRISMVFQDFGRYQMTVRDNITLGDSQQEADDAELRRAVENAGLAGVIEGWKEGFETRLGRWLQPGTEPSAGQWQRIALARAFFRNADLLVMDEPTSSLDLQARYDMLERLSTMPADRMALFVSHRLELVEWADRVVVLTAGEVRESGTMAELLRNNGEFVRLFSRWSHIDDED